VSRRRRGLLLVGLALVLGGLAASDVARREAALERRLAPLVDVVVARADLRAGRALRVRDLEVRRVPARWAPPSAASAPEELAGGAPAVDVAAGDYVTLTDLAAAGGRAGASVRAGERAVEIVAAGSPDLVVAGTRVDVLVTRERGGTEVALQDVEVLDARAALDTATADPGAARVAATLRVTLRQAVFLTAAQSFARELRLLPRAAGDGRRVARVRVGTGLR
jgi:pilus assembly protein CpaB